MIKNIKDSNFLKLDKRFYTKTEAIPLDNPKLVSYNKKLALKMGIDKKFLKSEDFIKLLNGEINLNSFASAYAGHQFGYFVPNLGDGRTLNLGKIDNYQLQLKGSGLTAYSRNEDGRAVLRSSIREYLISEAMYALGIPTTRALGIISSDTKVYRQNSIEQGSIVLRVSPSWIRFGSFEFAYLGKHKKRDIKALADYVIGESFAYLKDEKNRYEKLFLEILDKTAQMIALWQAYGFMHGVMNTDNMSILGLTIDYGPFAFMEVFDKDFTCNLSDYEDRYSYENQPYIAGWNLQVLAKVFTQIADENILDKYLKTFIPKYKQKYLKIMYKKLGFELELKGDKKLIKELLKALQNDRIDYTSFFYNLSKQKFDNIDGKNIQIWLEKYKTRISKEEKKTIKTMKKVNPKYILRNYMLQDAIDKAEQGDFKLVNDLLKIAQNPFDEHKAFEEYTQTKSEQYSLKCSCSS